MKSSGNSSAPSPRPPSDPRSDTAPSRKRFALTGRSRAYDPATTAARADIADVRLAERIFAPHYAAPLPRRLISDTSVTATRDGEAIGRVAKGDVFEVLEFTAAHAWGVVEKSGLVGFVPLAALASA